MSGINGARNILIVEDEPSIARVCVRTLGAEGYHIGVAHNGRMALAELNRQDYDLCLVDIRTPDMNGIELYRHLEQSKPEVCQRIIFTTGDVMGADVKVFLDETHRPYLAKPFSPGELRAMVRTALDRVSQPATG